MEVSEQTLRKVIKEEIATGIKHLATQESLDRLAQSTADGFNAVDAHFEKTDAQIAKIESAITNIKQGHLDQDTKRLVLERRVGAIDNRVAILENEEE